jgi:D-alanine transaminase
LYVEAKPFSPPLPERENGVAAILTPDERWGRCDLKTIGLLPNVLARQQAGEEGAYEAIFCRDGFLQEGTHSSILFVRDGTLIAPPLTNCILPGITRGVVFDLARAESIQTETRPCPETELFDFQEVLMVGTASEIVPITSVNGTRIGRGTVGPVTRKLQAAFARKTVREVAVFQP